MRALNEVLIYMLGMCHLIAALAHGRRDADFVSVRTRLDRPYVDLVNEPPEKYFHESSFHQHYDGRFADRPLKYDEKQAHLSALIQTYLSTMNTFGAETWLMHGTLLGWWWNRRVMPWDSDLDVMLSEKSLHLLANYYNMTMHKYRVPGKKKAREYLLEVNPHYSEAALDRQNRIDARWIDTESGLFIDITTLRSNSSAAFNADHSSMVVKDKHHYLFDDIYPLRTSVFEDIPVCIPYAYPDILIEEYGDEALASVNYEGHHFNIEQEQWLPSQVSILTDLGTN